jgi:hypothetical protein
LISQGAWCGGESGGPERDDGGWVPVEEVRAEGHQRKHPSEVETNAFARTIRCWLVDQSGASRTYALCCRFYYRCAYSAEGCGATRRVQQSQEDPAAFVIAYYGDHTCGSGAGDACQRGVPPLPPAVIDSNACAMVCFFDQYQNVESPQPLLAAEQSWRHHGEAPGQTSRGRWSSSSSSSSSSEAERGTSPVLEFLEGSLGVGWESVVNYLGFTDLPQTAMPQ